MPPPQPAVAPGGSTAASQDWLPRRFASGGLLVVVVASALLLGTLSRSGIWEPEELSRAERARRIAIHLFDADTLRVPGAANHLPTLSDLGAGELGYTSMAWGLSTFGLSDYAGRLPLALWALAAVVVLYVWLARLASVRVGWVAALVLCSMPLFVMQARTMLGDAVTMSAFVFCFAGLSGAWLDEVGGLGRMLWCLLALFGALAGYLSRGLLIGVAAPTLGVGLSMLAWRFSSRDGPTHNGHIMRAGRLRSGATWVGWVALAVGLGAVIVGFMKLHAAGWGASEVDRDLGVAILTAAPRAATFDLAIRQLGHGLFPWSALLPFALAACVRKPPRSAGVACPQEAALRLSLVIGATTAYVIHGYLEPYTGSLPYTGTALLAAVIAIALVDVARSRRGSGPVAVGTLLLALLLARDLSSSPVRTLSVLGVSERYFPSDFQLAEQPWLWVMTLVFGLGLALALLDDDGAVEGPLLKGGARPRYALIDWLGQRVRQYETSLTQLNTVWRGNLAFGFLLVEAALVGLAVTLWLGRRADWVHLRNVPHTANVLGFNAWWVLPLALALLPVLLDMARFSFAWCLRLLRLSRSSAAVLVAVGAALCGSLVFYPAAAGQLSPKIALEDYAQRHTAGEPLGLLGVSGSVARYYADGSEVISLLTVRKAANWLLGDALGQRRWLVVRYGDIAEINAAYRELEGSNVPVVGGGDGFPLLLSNRLNGARDFNPLAGIVMQAPPRRLQHEVSATLDGKLQLLGWDVIGRAGKPVRFVVPGQPFMLRSYYRVTGTIRRDYQAFLHIDGDGRRHNGDHPVLEDRYPMALWRLGDVVVDRYEFVLEPNFSPGDYRVYLGFFRGKQRMEVTVGRHHENRIEAGVLHVR